MNMKFDQRTSAVLTKVKKLLAIQFKYHFLDSVLHFYAFVAQ